MTRMSDPSLAPGHGFGANPARSLEGSALARALHLVPSPVLLLPLFLVACVIPPSLSVDTQDAGIDSPPAIVSVRSDQTELPEPGPVLFAIGSTAGSLNLTLVDTDIGDTLYVRIFVDYNTPDPTPPRSTCSTASSTALRTATCPLNGLCETADLGQTRNLTIVVFDRQVLDSGAPLYQSIPPGGMSTSRFYFLKCQQPSS